MNPYDTHAMEAALQLKDQFGCKVVVLSMGPPNAEATLRKALSAGVDRAILLSDRALAGPTPWPPVMCWLPPSSD